MTDGLFRSFLPLHNPIGFGVADFVEIVFLVSMAGFYLLYRSRGGVLLSRLAMRTGWCMLVIGVTPIVLRLLLLRRHPIPTPSVSDDFSYLLAADTLAHFRFANASHPLSQFFETFFVLQQPSYSSIFPLGQAFFLVVGKTLTASDWGGVALTTGALAAGCYWMLRAWIAPRWAAFGGFLDIVAFGPLSQWMNSFWGGAVSGCAGCLVFGALPRQRTNPRYAWLIGIGLGLQILTRPFESVFMILAVAVYFLFVERPGRHVLVALLPVACALVITLVHDRAVTGSWTTLPYSLSRYQYGVPATFTFQPNPQPHRDLTPEQKLDYEMQSAVHGPGTDTLWTYLTRWASRLRFYRFFLPAPLYFALPFAILAWRRRSLQWAALTVLLFSAGTNFYPYFYPHYIASIGCLLFLLALVGLEQLSTLTVRSRPVGHHAAIILILLAISHFFFWYGVHLIPDDRVFYSAIQYEPWDAINRDDPEGRIAVRQRLVSLTGKHLVFVRYSPRHTFQEWVHNDADIDRSRIVWARDLGSDNVKLVQHYPDRSVWLLEPDYHPPKLTRYVSSATAMTR